MSDYDSMSVEELLDAYVDCCNGGWGDWAGRLLRIKSALRKEVLREAAVATLNSKENEDGLRWILVHTDVAPKFEYRFDPKEPL